MKTLSMPIGPEDHSLGPASAPITIVQYGRYDCPHCLQALTVVDDLRSLYDARLRLIYRHFPVEDAHSPSDRAAQAAEAAAAQGKFWEMHTLLLQNQNSLDDANLIAHAAMLGLDTQQFASELAAGAYADRVRRQFQSGLDSGVHSTPTFFINGIRHDDYWDLETMTAAIETSTHPED